MAVSNCPLIPSKPTLATNNSSVRMDDANDATWPVDSDTTSCRDTTDRQRRVVVEFFPRRGKNSTTPGRNFGRLPSRFASARAAMGAPRIWFRRRSQPQRFCSPDTKTDTDGAGTGWHPLARVGLCWLDFSSATVHSILNCGNDKRFRCSTVWRGRGRARGALSNSAPGGSIPTSASNDVRRFFHFGREMKTDPRLGG
jgi:hypothetical protein